MRLIVATKNAKKLQEIRDILKGLKVEVVSLADFPKTPRIVENGKTFRENAVKKAVKIAHFAKELTLGEDSGLCVDALGGRPGVYSSRFSGKGKSDAKNNAKVLKLTENVPFGKRGAHYVCAVALADQDGLIAVVEGKCYGRISFRPQGNRGFGYDPLFLIPKYNLTFAQLGEGIKHKMSHRYFALEKAKKVIQKYIEKRRGH